MKLGKIEKFILRYLWYRQLDAHNIGLDDYPPYTYRSQIVFVLYNIRFCEYKYKYRKNLKNFIPDKNYNNLQVLVTRSIKSLESKGLLERKTVKNDYFKLRKYKFCLTELGLEKAYKLSYDNPIYTTKDVFP